MSKPKRTHLRNGMSFMFVPQEGAVSTTVFVYVSVGSRYEMKEVNGASHFIEHLMFKGTKRRPSAQDISRELDGYGAMYNAYTSKDHTAYYVKTDPSHVPNAIDLLHDMLFHSVFDPKEIDRERGVILEEINMYEDNPQRHVEDLLEEALFPKSSLGWNIAGPRQVIRTIPSTALKAYHDQYYIPSRMCVVVAGKIPSGTHALLEKTFGSVHEPKREAPAYAPFCAPSAIVKPLKYEEKKTEQSQIAMAFYGYPVGHANESAAKMLGIILGGYMSSRLFVQVRERRGLCYSIRAGHDSMADVGVFQISAGLDRKRLPLAIQTIVTELRKVKRGDVDAEELQRAKDHIRGKLALAFEDSAYQAGWYGDQWIYGQRVQTPTERLRQLEGVSRQDVVRVACEMLAPKRMAIAAIGPLGGRGALEKKFIWR
jgi:predicted Zn-dependent peptidase